MTAWDELQRLMPPTAAGDTPVDWNRMAQSWGREFPSDYRRFIDVYGSGSIEGYLAVLKPSVKAQPVAPGSGAMADETINAEHAWAREPKASELDGANPVLIAWGVDSSADILCWDASGADSGTWPVLVRNRDDNLWRRYDCGMAEFLVRILRAEFDDCPLGDLSLWDSGSALFLNETEKRRRIEQGLDPWTGEPDPFAGMSWG